MIEYKKHLLELPKEEIIERYLQVCENVEILDSSNKRLRKQLSIYGVGCSSLKDKEPKCLNCGSNNIVWTMCKDCGNDPFN